MQKNFGKMEGVVTHKLDPKCRVAVPSNWRPAEKDALRLMQATSYEIPVLRVLTEDLFQEWIKKLEEKEDWSVSRRRKAAGALFSRCTPVHLSEHGKLAIPKNWCEKAEISPGKEAVLVGRGKSFELYKVENYEVMVERENAEIKEINETLGYF